METDQNQMKRKRTVFDQREKAMFWDIVTHFQLSQKLIVATAILFNMWRIWGDGEPDDEDGEGGDHADHEAVEECNFVVEEGHPSSVRIRGQAERQRLLDNMTN